MEKARTIVIKEGVTARIEVWKHPGFEEVRGSVRLCGLDDEDRPFRLYLDHQQLEELTKAIEDLVVELMRAEEAAEEGG